MAPDSDYEDMPEYVFAELPDLDLDQATVQTADVDSDLPSECETDQEMMQRCMSKTESDENDEKEFGKDDRVETEDDETEPDGVEKGADEKEKDPFDGMPPLEPARSDIAGEDPYAFDGMPPLESARSGMGNAFVWALGEAPPNMGAWDSDYSARFEQWLSDTSSETTEEMLDNAELKTMKSLDEALHKCKIPSKSALYYDWAIALLRNADLKQSVQEALKDLKGADKREKLEYMQMNWVLDKKTAIAQKTQKLLVTENNDTMGEYLPFTVVYQREGGDAPAFAAAKNYVLSALVLQKKKHLWRTLPWVQWNHMTKRVEWLYIKTQYRQSSMKSWEDRLVRTPTF